MTTLPLPLAALLVGGGAALGAILRWTLGVLFNGLHPQLMLGTLAANLIGGYGMGLVLGAVASAAMSPALRLLLTTGFLGGLTTFSAFSGESIGLLLRGHFGWALAHIALHLLGSLAMTALGLLTVQLLRS